MPHPRSRARWAATACALLVVGVVAVFVPAAPAGAARATHRVRPGGSIQAAVNSAHPGDRIVVEEGTYAEQVTVKKDGLELIGIGAVLVPPRSPATNTCSGLAGPGTQAGICVAGQNVRLAPFEVEHRKLISVGRRVRDVSVSGFIVRGFSGPNVALVGTDGVHVFSNRLRNGNAYGALSVGSIGNWIFRNHVSADSIRFIGICVDDVSGARVAFNDVSRYAIGLCIQTQGAGVAFNDLHGNCVGIYVDPGIGADVFDNNVETNNAPCGDVIFSGVGIILSGTVGTQVIHNRIENHHPSPDFGAGLVVVDAGPDLLVTDTVVRNNSFARNTLDIQVFTSGTGNSIEDNDCTTSDPAGYC